MLKTRLHVMGWFGLFVVAFFMVDRVVSGVVQCRALGCLPW